MRFLLVDLVLGGATEYNLTSKQVAEMRFYFFEEGSQNLDSRCEYQYVGFIEARFQGLDNVTCKGGLAVEF